MTQPSDFSNKRLAETHASEFLSKHLAENNHSVSATVQQQMLQYLDLMQRWNKIHNLTRIEETQESILLHLIDSLAINPYLKGQRVLDVGTGAGLPGIPLALVNSDKTFVLLDSNSKKIRFLTQVIIDLKLTNVTAVHQRVEDFKHEAFDCILTRAFSSLQVMLEKTQHLISEMGLFLAMKGQYPTDELSLIPAEFKVLAIHELKISGLNAKRHLICITKES